MHFLFLLFLKFATKKKGPQELKPGKREGREKKNREGKS